MTPEQQRVKIAEACGWSVHHAGKYVAHPGGTLCDPLTDLNAMHEAEKVLKDDQMERYWLELNGLLHVWSRGRRTWVFESPADIRAQAFLRTLGLWKD